MNECMTHETSHTDTDKDTDTHTLEGLGMAAPLTTAASVSFFLIRIEFI